MKPLRVFIFAAAIAAAAGPIAAQPRELTVEECVAIGLQNSKALYSSQKKSDYADAKASEVSASLYPALSLLGSYQRLSDVPQFVIPIPGHAVTFPVVLNNYYMKATFQQPLFTGWRLQGAVSSAGYSAQAAGRDVEKDRLDLIYSVRTAYWNLYQARELKRLADENVEQVGLHLRDITNMENQGMATRNDVLKVEVQLSNSKLLQSDAVNNAGIALLTLNSTLGLPLTTDIVLASGPNDSVKTFPKLDELLSSAFDGRPDIRATQLRVEAARAGLTAARGSWWPQIFLTGDYYYSRPNQRYFPPLDEFRNTWDLGISFQLDVWNNLTALHKSDEAEAQLEQTRSSLDMLRDGVTLEVTRAYMTFGQAKEKIGLSRLGVDQADENYRITHDKFENGLATNSDLLDAEAASLQAHLQLTSALVDLELAAARLERAVGEDTARSNGREDGR